MEKRMVFGIIAHVDSGKTTLSEAMLYKSGSIRKLGRVDSRDAFLDTDAMERERGITIFSKQAVFSYQDMDVTLLDTPGHVDFSAETERTLQVLDYCILVINGMEGVQAHTRTLWRLLKHYQVPVFVFVNKMDMAVSDKDSLLKELQTTLDAGCTCFEDTDSDTFFENIASCDEAVMERYFEEAVVDKADICRLIRERKVFPCYFGSALKVEGIDELLNGMYEYTTQTDCLDEFGARVFKINRDAQGNRLTLMKITGGSLKVKESIGEEKINQIRIYSGEKYEAVQEAFAGQVCAVTGLLKSAPGESLGMAEAGEIPVLEPVLTYRVILPVEVDASAMLPKLRVLEEEEPQLHLVWDEILKEIQVRIMGEVQLEVLQRMIKDRFGIVAEFEKGNVVYKETIAKPAIGVGHFEPLRHYAEVQLLLEPGEAGSGLVFAADCSEDILAKNWQRLILTHLEEKEHKGVLSGAPITDMKLTLLAGRAHLKHTEGGDFRQATYRAVRQGLMETESVLLEPYYAFVLDIPEKMIGRAMTDVERMSGKFEIPTIENGRAVLTGIAPVSAMQGYQKEVTVYSQGMGYLNCTLKGYYPCHNAEEVLSNIGYDPEADLRNPSGSVFCAHGAGYVVPWYEVKENAHVEIGGISEEEKLQQQADRVQREYAKKGTMAELDAAMGTEEIDRIINQATHANVRADDAPRKGIYKKKKPEYVAPVTREYTASPKLEEYLLVDGYNVIFAWDELKSVAEVSIDGARGKLLDILCDYQAMRGCRLMVVFDAYRVQGHATEITDYHNIQVVYTKEAETADRFIEKFAHENSKKFRMTVATSDGLEQIIIRGQGCGLLSARDLHEEIGLAKENLRENYLEKMPKESGKIYLLDGVDIEGFKK